MQIVASHHVQFVSGVSPSTEVAGITPFLSVQTPLLHLVRLKAPSSFKSAFYKLSLIFPLHVLFGRPLFLFPRTSKSNATSVRYFLLSLEHAQTIAIHLPSPHFNRSSQAKHIHQVFGAFSVHQLHTTFSC